ncbi:MAG: anhydro-N-acetylmuramic acid kinase [Betaproteobacteria bacterium]|nr:anhydro-N-acetylmuramic acid kinase [Betaproteobacteria bacterium]
MSGTSMDGLDACHIEASTKGPRRIASASASMPSELRANLMRLQVEDRPEAALDLAAQSAGQLADEVSRLVRPLLDQASRAGHEIKAIGVHGQTLRHRPEQGYSLQIINPARLAESLGVTVVFDFRSRDIAAGGEGAPLVPVFHLAMTQDLRAQLSDPGQGLAVVNLGGMANITLLTRDGEAQGFDTGPGNTLLDAWCSVHQGTPFDAEGAWAASGRADDEWVDELLREPYFQRTGPKSTGRDQFNLTWITSRLAAFEQRVGRSLSAVDVQASLLRLTARSIARACPTRPAHLILCGGGTRNTALIRALARETGTSPTLSSDVGWPEQEVEAAAFAWLAFLNLSGLPGNLPSVTGARGPRVLGSVCPAGRPAAPAASGVLGL